MDIYSVALFGHIVGALLLFVLLAVEGLSYRMGFGAAPINRVLGPVSLVLILLPGLYMMKVQWGWTGWVVIGIASYALMAAAGAFAGINVLRGAMTTRTALVTWFIRVGLALGVVFDMTVKPDLPVAAAAVVAGAALGALAAVAAPRRVLSA